MDLTGQVFGQLTVIGDSGQRKSDGSIVWKCSCACGNTEYYTVSSELKRKGARAKTHCNNTIHQINDLTGQFFGDLEVIKIDESTIGERKIKWCCKCHNCNRDDLVSILGNSLLSNKSQTCGCGHSISRNASKIKEILDIENINYISEFSFDNLKLKNKLRFDFAVF